jgi:uncharacterized transporter YbjL
MAQGQQLQGLGPVVLASCLATFLGFLIPTFMPWSGQRFQGFSLWGLALFATMVGLGTGAAVAFAQALDWRHQGVRTMAYALLASMVTLATLFALGWLLFHDVGTHCVGPAVNGTRTCYIAD